MDLRCGGEEKSRRPTGEHPQLDVHFALNLPMFIRVSGRDSANHPAAQGIIDHDRRSIGSTEFIICT